MYIKQISKMAAVLLCGLVFLMCSINTQQNAQETTSSVALTTDTQIKDNAEVEKSGSQKKGFCVSTTHDSKWAEKVKILNAKWYYTWGGTIPAGSPEGIEFIPMTWNLNGGTESLCKQLAEGKKKGIYKNLLAYNEPDGRDQANMTVEKAIEGWPLLMSTGLRLGSPAAVNADGEWMQQFMKEIDAKGYRVDFITFHSYGGIDSKHFLERLDKIHEMYNRPIWITEFAVADWRARRRPSTWLTPESAYKFMEEVLPGLEQRDYIEKYTWFSQKITDNIMGSCALFNEDGTLTKLGELYAKY